MRNSFLIGLLLCAKVSVAFAQTPTVLEIEKEQQRIEVGRKRMFDARNPATQNTANSFPNLPTPARAGMDIETMARQYEQKAETQKTDGLMIFASFTMPDESLKNLLKQANRVGASVVLRGFKNNSIKETALAIHALGEAGGNIAINPKSFTQYKIEAVPTVVLTKAEGIGNADEQGCALPEHFIAVSGDVSLDYALAQIVQRAPQWESIATSYLRQLQ